MTIFFFILMILMLLVLRQPLIMILIAVAGYVHLVWGSGDLSYLADDIWAAADNEVILAVPLFILVGQVMSNGATAKRLVNLMAELARPLPGGLAVGGILACAFFSAICGSSIVTMMAIGSIMYPALTSHGYKKSFSIGALAAGGTLGMIIPPSVPMILYGIVTQTSIADLFLAGVGPGILITSMLAIYAMVMNRKLHRESWNRASIAKAFREGIWSLMLPVVLLGGIYSGWMSPTEAAAVGLAYAVFVEMVIHREMNLAGLFGVTLEAGKLIGMLFPVIAVAISLNQLGTIYQLPQTLVAFTLQYVDGPITFILLVNLLLLVAGCIMDTISAILIMGPLLAPIASAFGYSDVLFGIIMILNLEIGFLTPPMGLNLIVAMTAFREKFGFVCRSAVPYVGLLLVCLLLVIFIPSIALALLGY